VLHRHRQGVCPAAAWLRGRRRRLDTRRRRQIHVLGMYTRRSPMCGRSWRRSSPRTLPPLLRSLHSCASMTSASATSSCTSSVGIASVGPACNSGLRVVVVPLLSRRCGRRQRHQPPHPRIGGAVLHTRGRREITEGRALQSLLPFFRTSR
jgi:hypothetical protein